MALADDVNIACQYQRVTNSGLICLSANTRGQHTINECSPEICSECEIGLVQRDVGCTHIGGEVMLCSTFDGTIGGSQGLWCKLKRRETAMEQCEACSYIECETSTTIVTTVIDLLDANGFATAKASILDARKQLQDLDFDGCIRNAAVSLESTLKITLDSRNVKYPSKEQLTELWKAVRKELGVDKGTEGQILAPAIRSLTGAVGQLAGIRNELSDAHGKGLISPEIYQSWAELAMNLASAVITFVVRRSKEGQ